jgi:small subunit ribosomal protein S16
MAVVIRMKRTGRRNSPCYRIAVSDSRDPRDGKVIEVLGLYDPAGAKPEEQIEMNLERAKHWLDQGAQPSDTVRSIIRRLDGYVGRPAPKPRKRPGRYKDTATRQARTTANETRAKRKSERQGERLTAKRAAAKAAAAAATAEE